MVDAQRERQIEKHRGLKCFVCGKWGADGDSYLRPVIRLKALVRANSLTVRAPDADGVHTKCCNRLTELLRGKGIVRDDYLSN